MRLGFLQTPGLGYVLLLCLWGYSIQSNAKEVTSQKSQGLSSIQFDANNIACWMSNNGKIVDDDITGRSGMEWPKGSGKHIDYASGFWLVGMDESGEVRSACAEYGSEWLPGTINESGLPNDPEDPRFRMYKINKDGSGDWDTWPFDLGAPALKARNGSDSLDTNGNKIPRLYGDQTIWYVMNDADSAQHEDVFGTLPLGVEVRVLAFGYDAVGPLGNVIFYEWTLINKSSNPYIDCYIGLFDDSDLGDASDDLIGCDPLLNLAYTYNGYPYDATYLFQVPALGFQLLKGPQSNKDEEPLGMTAFADFGALSYGPWGHPESAEEAHNFLKGLGSDGKPRKTPQGKITPFALDGDPVAGKGWLDERPDNRWGLMSSGPFDLQPEDVQVVRAAKLVAQGDNFLNSITKLRKTCDMTTTVHDQVFHNTFPELPLVMVECDRLDHSAQISWSAPETFDNRHLLGYKLFQVKSEDSIELAAFDAIDGITEIRDVVNGQETVVYQGDENGIETTFTVERDAFTQQPFQDGFRYYFAVQAFYLDEKASPGHKVIQNPLEPVAYRHVSSDYTGRFEARHVQGDGDGHVEIHISEPEYLTGHRYEISFDGPRDELTMIVTDVDLDHPIYSGEIRDIYFDSLGFYVLASNDYNKLTWDATESRWITGVNWGGRLFIGGMDTGANFFGSTIGPEESFPMRIEFQNHADVTAQGYRSRGAVYRRDLDYEYAGTGELPMEAFDVTDPEQPRKVNICFVEDNNAAPANLIWDMACDGSDCADDLGAREYLFFMSSDYDGGAIYDDENYGPSADVVWGMWPKIKPEHSYLEAPFEFNVYRMKGLSEQDVFAFYATMTDVQARLSLPETSRLYPNFPNPFNASTTIRFEVAHSGRVELIVFDILGRQVKALMNEHKAAGDYNILWNAADVPSGLYFVRFIVDDNVITTNKMLLVK